MAFAAVFMMATVATHAGNAPQTDVQTSEPMTADNIMADRNLQGNIKGLIEKKFKRYNINISVYGGNVILRGYVDNDATKQDIEQEVKKMQGVKSVNNMLNISPKKGA